MKAFAPISLLPFRPDNHDLELIKVKKAFTPVAGGAAVDTVDGETGEFEEER